MKYLAVILLWFFTSAAFGDVQFDKRQLTDVFHSEGAAAGDFNRDGKMDVVSGPYWYEGPDFERRHEFAPVKSFDPARGYSDSFFAFTHDFNGDGWIDILIIGFPGTTAGWYENPGNKPGHWRRHIVIEKGVDNESPTFADLTGDGRPELILHTRGRLGYATPDPTDPAKPWTFHPVSTPSAQRGPFTHGLGIGDVDGDGRADILERGGWWRQPESLEGDPVWEHHPADFGNGAQIHVYDVDGDGLADVIGSLDAHGYGLAWFRQVRAGDGKITFEKHLIMGGPDEPSDHEVVFSQLHALDLADINGDGLLDIVTGKRFWAHGTDKDPEPNAPAVIYWFELVRVPGQLPLFVPHEIDDDSGVGTQVLATDVDGDGRADVIVGNKKGTFVFIQHR